MEPIDMEKIMSVNIPSRELIVKEKTMDVFAKAAHVDHKLWDAYDLLAHDWIYSDKADWIGSLPERKLRKILEVAHDQMARV